MSDFFYKEKIGPLFSPIITVKRENVSPTVVSALDNLLSPSGNMFTRAETVRDLMKLEGLNLEQTAKALSIKSTDVANKLRLLEFSQKERLAILEYGFSESSAVEFLRLDKVSRLYCIEYCRKNGYDADGIKEYIDGVVKEKSEKKKNAEKKMESVRKFIINDIGFFINSIENALRIARNAGFEVEDEKSENDEFYNINIRVKKQDNG